MIEYVNQILQGNALDVLKTFSAESIDMCLTSPPYWNLRDYKIEGQIGLESTIQEYLENLLVIFDEVKRVLKKTGSCWINIGDAYASSGSQRFDKNKYGGKNGIHCGRARTKEIQAKSLCLIPYRFAIEMCNRGWILRNDIIWSKQVLIKSENRTIGNAMPASSRDRFNHTYEHLFFFTKNKKYYSDLDSVRMGNQVLGVTEFRASGFERASKYDSKYLNHQYSPKGSHIRKDRDIHTDYYKKSKYFRYPDQKADSLGGRLVIALATGTISPDIIKKLQDIGFYLKTKLKESGIKIEELSNILNTPKTTLEHYFRTDITGQMIPSRPVWDNMKSILQLDDYDNCIPEEIKSALPQPHELGKNLPSIWQINTKPHNFKKELGLNIEHFAAFPETLLEIPIKFSCPLMGIVLDPFIGSGTTGLVAKSLGRNFIGIELKPDYIKLANKRLMSEIPILIKNENEEKETNSKTPMVS